MQEILKFKVYTQYFESNCNLGARINQKINGTK